MHFLLGKPQRLSWAAPRSGRGGGSMIAPAPRPRSALGLDELSGGTHCRVRQEADRAECNPAWMATARTHKHKERSGKERGAYGSEDELR